MKMLKLVVVGIMFFVANTSWAQVSVSVSFGSPPLWGPVGYADVRYYYLPDIEAYYDIQSTQFIYYDDGIWIHRAYLPSRYSNYDLYSGYKVVMNDYTGNAPYSYFNMHKKQYAKGYKGKSQKTFGLKPGDGNYDKKKKYNNNSGKRENKGNDKNENHEKHSGKGKNK